MSDVLAKVYEEGNFPMMSLLKTTGEAVDALFLSKEWDLDTHNDERAALKWQVLETFQSTDGANALAGLDSLRSEEELRNLPPLQGAGDIGALIDENGHFAPEDAVVIYRYVLGKKLEGTEIEKPLWASERQEQHRTEPPEHTEPWIEILDNEGESPMSRLHKADKAGANALANELMVSDSETGVLGEHPIHDHARCSRIKEVRQLIEAGADVNDVGPEGLAPLHWAALNGSFDLTKLLLIRGADVNVIDRNFTGLTPFGMAKMMGYDEVTNLLTQYGATH